MLLQSPRCLWAWFFVGLALVASCSKPPNAPLFVSVPVIETLSDHPVSLAAIVSFTADQPVSASYTIVSDDDQWLAASNDNLYGTNGELLEFTANHRDLLLRFKPGKTHKIYVSISNAAGQKVQFGTPLVFVAPPLPDGFPDMIALGSLKEAIDRQSVTFVSVEQPAVSASTDVSKGPLAKPLDGSSTEIKVIESSSKTDTHQRYWLIGLNQNAEVIWFMPVDQPIASLQSLQSGNLRLFSHRGSAFEVDMLGKTHAVWREEDLAHGDRYPEDVSDITSMMPMRSLRSRPLLLNDDGVLLTDEYTVWQLNGEGNLTRQWDLQFLLDEYVATRSKHSPLSSEEFHAGSTDQFDCCRFEMIDYHQASDVLVISVEEYNEIIGVGLKRAGLRWVFPLYAKDSMLAPSETFATGSPVSADQARVIGDHVYVPQAIALNGLSGVHGIDLNERTKPLDQHWQLSFERLTVSQLSSMILASAQPEGAVALAINQRIDSPLVKSSLVNAQVTTETMSHLYKILFATEDTSGDIQNQPSSHLQLTLPQSRIMSIATMPRMVAPLLGSSAGMTFASNGIDDAQPAAADDSEELIKPLIGQSHDLTGTWRIVFGEDRGQVGERLVIDQQRGSLALGELFGYPVIINQRGDDIAFTTRTDGPNGRIEFIYRGVVSPSGTDASGFMNIVARGGETLETGVVWIANRL